MVIDLNLTQTGEGAMKRRKVFIIAEAGVNHNRSLRLARKMITAAAKAGADAVKFQTFKADSLVSKFAPKAEYQKRYTDSAESQFDMIRKLELNERMHRELIRFCRSKKIIFLSSPFDLRSIELLKRLGLRTFKIPSGEITNLPYLRAMGRLKARLILSTGMADMDEIRRCIKELVKAGTPKNNITVLHCNTEYPTPFKDANLLAMLSIRDALNIDVGYSDHTTGIEAPIAAAALGATIIEKHFTLDRDMKGPDHAASLEPEELKLMIGAVRNIEEALGDGLKRPSASEKKNRYIARKSIVASKDIKKGDVFTESNITSKRPGTGITPMKWDSIIGRKAKKDIKRDEPVKI